MRTKSVALIAIALAAVSCKPAGETAKVDIAAEETAIRAKETAWMEAYNRHDATALAAQFADDGASANPGMALLTDAASRRAHFDALAADPALKVDFASDRIIVARSGDLASSRGHYSFSYTDPATKQPKSESGTYVTVYRKAADGSWKAVEDIIAPGPAAVAPAQ